MCVHRPRRSRRKILACALLVGLGACARGTLQSFEVEEAGIVVGDDPEDAGESVSVPQGKSDAGRATDAALVADAAHERDAGSASDAGHASDTGVAADSAAPTDAGQQAGSGTGSTSPPPVDAGTAPLPVTEPPPTPPAVDAGSATTSPPVTDLCKLSPYDVAILGDSFIRLSGDFTRFLQNKARAAGVLGPNDTYVDSSQTFASMNGTPGIPGQYSTALAESKRRGGTGPKLVIMTGGGQDVLIDNRTCLNPKSVDEVAKNATCVGVVDKVLSTAQQLIDTGVASGSKAAIYFFYPNLPENSLAGGANGNSVLNYAAPRAKAFCEGQTKMPCYFIDMRPPFEDASNPGHPRDGLIGFDGVNPTALGSQILADEVWKMMEAKCLGVKK